MKSVYFSVHSDIKVEFEVSRYKSIHGNIVQIKPNTVLKLSGLIEGKPTFTQVSRSHHLPFKR